MPEYLYICPEGHPKPVNHRMDEDPTIICECGKKMHRKPQAVSVNWGGLKPSDVEQRPQVIQELVDRDHGKSREDYQKYKARHKK